MSMPQPPFLLNDKTLTVDEFAGVIPKEGYLVKVYCKKMSVGVELKKQILASLKLRRLVEAEIDRIINLNPHRISWYTRQQLLEKLLEESKK